MSEVLNKYGVLKSIKTTENDSNVESLHTKNEDDQETSNTFGTSIEGQKEVIKIEWLIFYNTGDRITTTTIRIIIILYIGYC